jgi:hypothetical protein
MLRHWSGLVLFLDDGRLEIDTNIVERGMKGVAIARNYVHPFVMHSVPPLRPAKAWFLRAFQGTGSQVRCA